MVEIMKRMDFIKIIKLRSVWKVDKRKGNYALPNGQKLSVYIERLVRTQMQLDSLAIRENGDLCESSGGNWNDSKKVFEDYKLFPAFQDNEICGFDEMERRIKWLIRDIVG
jgi:hypothetical protein